MINITNEDNMQLMARYEDNYFDLAIVDPPYGINASKGVGLHSRRKFQKAEKEWDNETPKQEYWNELFRVSKNQIVCGANYFLEYLYSNKSFICWVKNNPAPSFAQAEFLWTSTSVNGKVYDSGKQIQHEIMWEGGSIHPTQKPVKLYEWILMNYAKEGDKILDTHGGSMSISLAVHNVNNRENMNISLDICELDKNYFNEGLKRYYNHIKQKTIFDI